jgi:DNA helicase MCM9
MDKR